MLIDIQVVLTMRIVLWIICCFLTSTALYAEAVLQPLHGKPIPFSTLQGQWVLINYWASWCQPCVEEIPELNQFYRQHQKEKFALFAVNYDMLPADLQEKITHDYHIHYPALRDDPAQSLHLGDIRGVPVTFIFNPQGVLTHTLYGGQTARGLNHLMV